MLNSKGPSIDPCGTPFNISNQELKNEPTLLKTITQIAFKKFKTKVIEPVSSKFSD